MLDIPRENIICVTMPCFGTTDRTYQNAVSLIHELGATLKEVNIEKAVAVYHNPQYQDETVFYLFTRPQDALAMVRQGVKIGTLNIGGMAWRPGKKQLTKAVSLDDDDINAFHELNNLGVILDLRVVASDPSINIIDKINEQLIAN